MGKTIIEIKDLRREFKMGGETLHVLKGIDLNIYEGEFITIMGPSGSGKSTLLNIFRMLGQTYFGGLYTRWYFSEKYVQELTGECA